MEYVLTIVDHGTDDLMRTCYEMYDMTLQDGTTLYDLLHYLQEQMEGMRYIEEKSTIAYEESEIPSYNEDVPPMVEEKERMVRRNLSIRKQLRENSADYPGKGATHQGIDPVLVCTESGSTRWKEGCSHRTGADPGGTNCSSA